MSYCVCFNCSEMVSGYEKYCGDCSKTYKQDFYFWKTPRNFGLAKEQYLDEDRMAKLSFDVDTSTPNIPPVILPNRHERRKAAALARKAK